MPAAAVLAYSSRWDHTMRRALRAACQRQGEIGYHRHLPVPSLRPRDQRVSATGCPLRQAALCQPFDSFCWHCKRTRGIAEFSAAREDIGESMASGLDRKRLSSAWRNRHVEIDWISGNSIHWALLSPKGAAHDPHVSAIIIGDFWDVLGLDLLVARRAHLER